MQDKWGHTNFEVVEKALKSFKASALGGAYADAAQVVSEARKADEKAHPVPAMYFKNSASQRKLNAVLAAIQ